MNKRYLVLSLLIVIAAAGLIFSSRERATAPATERISNQPAAVQTTIKPSEHILGNTNSKVTLVEYADYQCPGCAAYYPIVKAVQTKYNDTIVFQFRNYPLTQIHLNSLAAALAAESAGMQGKYWEMHDIIYENQEAWAPLKNAQPAMQAYAAKLNLDMTKFNKDFQDPATKAIIGADTVAAEKLNIKGTPTFILNGKKIEMPPTTVEDFSAIIDAELAV
jgi:protein-disulfide isomerase